MATDFPDTKGVILASRLMGQMTVLRRILYKNDKTVFYSTFSKWRKESGSQGSETISQAQALHIVFLGTYAKSGKLTFKKTSTNLEPEALASQATRWLHDMGRRMGTTCELPEDAPIHALLQDIAKGLPPLKTVLEAIDHAIETGATDRKRVSLRTLQRKAKAKKLKLSLSHPLPKELVKEIFK